MTRSNSHSPDTCVRFDVSSHGLDTVSLAWRGADAYVLVDAMCEAKAAGKARQGPAGAYLQTIGEGVTVGCYPHHGLAFIEGRLAPILSGDPHDRALHAPRDLRDFQDAIYGRACSFYGLAPSTPDIAAVRRADLSVDVGFSGGGGCGLLDGLSGLDPPRYKLAVYKSGQRTETVNLITSKRGVIVLRAYDKGVEQGSEAPGAMIRLERPMRYGKATQMEPGVFAEKDHGSMHAGGLAPFVDQAEGLRVVTPVDAGSELVDMWRGGRVTRAEARRLAGHVLFAQFSVPVTETESRLDGRDRAALRSLGLAVTGWDVMEGQTLALGEVLRAVNGAWDES